MTMDLVDHSDVDMDDEDDTNPLSVLSRAASLVEKHDREAAYKRSLEQRDPDGQAPPPASQSSSQAPPSMSDSAHDYPGVIKRMRGNAEEGRPTAVSVVSPWQREQTVAEQQAKEETERRCTGTQTPSFSGLGSSLPPQMFLPPYLPSANSPFALWPPGLGLTSYPFTPPILPPPPSNNYPAPPPYYAHFRSATTSPPQQQQQRSPDPPSEAPLNLSTDKKPRTEPPSEGSSTPISVGGSPMSPSNREVKIELSGELTDDPLGCEGAIEEHFRRSLGKAYQGSAPRSPATITKPASSPPGVEIRSSTVELSPGAERSPRAEHSPRAERSPTREDKQLGLSPKRRYSSSTDQGYRSDLEAHNSLMYASLPASARLLMESYNSLLSAKLRRQISEEMEKRRAPPSPEEVVMMAPESYTRPRASPPSAPLPEPPSYTAATHIASQARDVSPPPAREASPDISVGRSSPDSVSRTHLPASLHSSSPSSPATTPATLVSVCGSVDEHFAKALGNSLWNQVKGQSESPKAGSPEAEEEEEEEDEVDDHFSKALGDTWKKLKEKQKNPGLAGQTQV